VSFAVLVVGPPGPLRSALLSATAAGLHEEQVPIVLLEVEPAQDPDSADYLRTQEVEVYALDALRCINCNAVAGRGRTLHLSGDAGGSVLCGEERRELHDWVGYREGWTQLIARAWYARNMQEVACPLCLMKLPEVDPTHADRPGTDEARALLEAQERAEEARRADAKARAETWLEAAQALAGVGMGRSDPRTLGKAPPIPPAEVIRMAREGFLAKAERLKAVAEKPKPEVRS
jgi:hypothetical protein